jgi:hypothetical protein
VETLNDGGLKRKSEENKQMKNILMIVLLILGLMLGYSIEDNTKIHSESYRIIRE